MTALFVVIFIEQWLKEKNHTNAILGLVLAAICLLVFGAENFMIPSMISILTALTLLRNVLDTGKEDAE